jgi:hypothetical protein
MAVVRKLVQRVESRQERLRVPLDPAGGVVLVHLSLLHGVQLLLRTGEVLMPRYSMVAIGFCLGVVIAGIVNAALVTLLPDGVRGVAIVWATTAVVTAVTMGACWAIPMYRRPRRE